MHSLFTALLYTLVKIWEQHKCPQTDFWVKNYGTYTNWKATQPSKKRK